MMNSACDARQWFVQSFVESVSFFSVFRLKRNPFCFLEAKRSLVCMPNKPLQHVITEHVISICFPIAKPKQRHQFEQALSPCGFVQISIGYHAVQHFQTLARIRLTLHLSVMCWKIQMVTMHAYWSIFLRLDCGPFCARCNLTAPVLCWIHGIPKSQGHNPIRDTWLVELISAGDIVFHLLVKSHGPVS